MWVQAGFSPDPFWEQTPRHYQLVMQGVRKRLEDESEARTGLAWETGAFSGLAGQGKLKNLSHYLRQTDRPRTPAELLATIKSMGGKSNMTVKRVKLERAND